MDRHPSQIPYSRFQVLTERRELLVDGTPTQIGNRAYDILELLIEGQGRLVTKDEIMARVWPMTTVEENNLQVQVATLRKALGSDRGMIKTVPGRGYKLLPEFFSSPVTAKEPSLTNLPVCVSALMGRGKALEALRELLASEKIVTLTGMGGIGKTRLAVALATSLQPSFADGVWLAEFAPLSNADLVPVVVAASLRLNITGERATSHRIAQAVATKHILVVLDNCEHVVYRAAEIAEALVRHNPAIRVLCTSREPLRAEGECIYKVPPLDIPVADLNDAEELAQNSAVQLFLTRVCSVNPDLRDLSIAPMAAAVCRRLEGIPLALELAAASAAMLGIDELAARLEDRFLLLTGGRRTALPRQQTLRATLDWSYDLLRQSEQRVL